MLKKGGGEEREGKNEKALGLKQMFPNVLHLFPFTGLPPLILLQNPVETKHLDLADTIVQTENDFFH